MTIAVLGANGFLGKCLSSHLESKGCKIIPLSLRSEALDSSLRELKNQRHSIDGVVFCSGLINGIPQLLDFANVVTVRKVLAALQDCPQVRWIHISSVSATHRLGPYGASKQDGENEITNSNFKNWVILRPSLIYGPGDQKNLTTLAQVVRSSPLIPVPYHPRIKVQPLFVSDICEAIFLLLKRQELKQKIWTMGGPEPIRVIDLARKLKSIYKSSGIIIPIPVTPIRWAANFLSRFLSNTNFPLQQFRFMHEHAPWDSSEIQKDLNLHWTGLDQGLSKTFIEQRN